MHSLKKDKLRVFRSAKQTYLALFSHHIVLLRNLGLHNYLLARTSLERCRAFRYRPTPFLPQPIVELDFTPFRSVVVNHEVYDRNPQRTKPVLRDLTRRGH